MEINTIGIAAPSGVLEDKEALERGVALLENRGLKTILAKNCFNSWRGLAGTDDERALGVMELFENHKIDAIISMRGGYGSLRLIDKLDYNIIRTNPKPFCGYSDSSILSAMFLKHAGLTSFSAPMLQGDFGAELVSSFTMDNFFEALKCKKLEFKGEALVRGSANGITWGGNLASICSLCGQDFIPDEPFIFFTEDLNEPVYKLDKMMTQLMNIEKFRTNIKGMVLGDFLGAPGFEEVFEQFNIPCASGFKITHEKDKITVPYGVKTSLNNGIFVVG